MLLCLSQAKAKALLELDAAVGVAAADTAQDEQSVVSAEPTDDASAAVHEQNSAVLSVDTTVTDSSSGLSSRLKKARGKDRGARKVHPSSSVVVSRDRLSADQQVAFEIITRARQKGGSAANSPDKQVQAAVLSPVERALMKR